MKSYDVLIVGRGIAGNTLALTLLAKGLTIKVVDLPKANSPSRLAAGLYSPFTGKNTVKTWLAEEMFPFLEKFYKKIEEQTGIPLLQIRTAYRPFLSSQDYNDWIGSGNEEKSSFFLHQKPDHEHYRPWIINPFGGIEYKHSGYVDTIAYLEAGAQLLQSGNCLTTEFFNHADVQETSNGIIWGETLYQYIVFCEGSEAMNNPFFPQIPIVPNKGEILTLRIEDFPLQEIITKGAFLIQKQPGLFHAGSTYRWKFDSPEPEERGATEIKEKINKWFNVSYEQINLQAGIRPASKDRRPLMGYLNERPRFLLFNGLGTKGISLAPYWAEELSKLIIHQKDLPEEVDIRRFYLN